MKSVSVKLKAIEYFFLKQKNYIFSFQISCILWIPASYCKCSSHKITQVVVANPNKHRKKSEPFPTIPISANNNKLEDGEAIFHHFKFGPLFSIANIRC